MSKETLIRIAKHNLSHAEAGTMELAEDIARIPAANYTNPSRFQQELKTVFRRLPLVIAPTAELRNPGDYKATDVAGVPVLAVRGKDGVMRAFINSCSHRGTAVALDGTGNRSRFVCPYHGWTFNQEGALVGVAAREEFGDIDTDCHGLTPLRTVERAGLIWCILDPGSTLDIEAFLCGYDSMLGLFGLESWHLFEKRTIAGPNWKIAYDGYLDLYHLPVLHKNTIGGEASNQANYYPWGPHQRVISPSRYDGLKGLSEDEWPMPVLMNGVWTIFPHISIASFYGGGRAIMLSQLFPGEHAGESFTTQYYLMESEPDDAQAREAHEQFSLLEFVVQEEDYATGLRQQKALESGGREYVMFGRNEQGGQRFHAWVDRILNTPDDKLNELFASTNERGIASAG